MLFFVGWNKIIKLGSVDCATKSKKGKDNGMGICFKSPYFIGGMPDCRVICFLISVKKYFFRKSNLV